MAARAEVELPCLEMSDPEIHFADFDRIVFFTGAGISAESGVPTYRGPGGIWKDYNYEDYACQAAFDRSPRRVWDFHNYRRALFSACAPSAGHEVIADLQRSRGVTVITQNIDGLHQLAGSREVIELHGSLWRLRCDACGARATRRDAPLEHLHCSNCGAMWRPDIVWFGDALDGRVLQRAEAAIRSAQLLVSVGTSAVVYPAAALPLVAKEAGALCVEVNPESTPMSDAYDVCLRMTASRALAVMAQDPV